MNVRARFVQRWLVIRDDWLMLAAVVIGSLIGIAVGVLLPADDRVTGTVTFLTFAVARAALARKYQAADRAARELRISSPARWLIVAVASMATWLGLLLVVTGLKASSTTIVVVFLCALTFSRVLARGVAGAEENVLVTHRADGGASTTTT